MSEVYALEQQLSNAKILVEHRDLALKLSKNHEFRKLILDIFCKEECARYAQASADPALPANERADSLAMAQAAGHLKRFLQVTITMGNVADRDIKDVEAMLQEARAEEDIQEGE